MKKPCPNMPLEARNAKLNKENFFYTPRGYIFDVNSFSINKSTSKPSYDFVHFGSQTHPKSPFSSSAAQERASKRRLPRPSLRRQIPHRETSQLRYDRRGGAERGGVTGLITCGFRIGTMAAAEPGAAA